MGKKALLIGCNYPGTKIELKGCINDILQMKKLLVGRYGFSDDDITVLIDTDHSSTQPTGKNIYNALTHLVQSAKPDDVLFIHYSGHGSRFPLVTDEDDEMGYDECIVPCDMNFIFGMSFFLSFYDDIRDIVHQVPEGCHITIISDSCHSGISLRVVLAYSARDWTLLDAYWPLIKIGSLALPAVIDILNKKTGKEHIDVANLRSTLFEIFGEEVSPKIKRFMKDKVVAEENGNGGSKGSLGMVGNKAQEFLKLKWKLGKATTIEKIMKDRMVVGENGNGGSNGSLPLGMVGNKAQEFLKLKGQLEKAATIENIMKERVVAGENGNGGSNGSLPLGMMGNKTAEFLKLKWKLEKEAEHPALPKGGILISGCQTYQVSGDVAPSREDAAPHGAFSHGIQTIIAESAGGHIITSKELVFEGYGNAQEQRFS
ncbi:hypothetical protein FEM48_Zijuj11G0155500 [Ziziphus jujuba var. spinosa]|uniref:Peptidase C14 caspase domain-containing protein n=1 Tax=Ziziphus jujuba var. spinosa TaxID=714518 RepID=A0A978UJS5_ZIZJJ|nr:hypothetical protein FEM48_Zijuj11G0155500 [Ziziphus jujuba var. spinosa]